MTLISFIIPCGRIPFELSGKRTVDSILLNHPDAEIIVCSKEQINYKNIIYVKEPSNNKGCVKPVNIMSLMATGNYICMLNDDYYLNNKSLNPAIEYIESKNLVGLSLMPFDSIGKGVGKCPFYIKTRSEWLDTTMFPIVKSKFIEDHGELIYFKLKHYYGDNTISIRLWKTYGQKEFVYDNNEIYVHSIHDQIINSLYKEDPYDFHYYKIFCQRYNIPYIE